MAKYSRGSALLIAGGMAFTSFAEAPKEAPDRILVRVKAHISEGDAQELHRSHGASQIDEITGLRVRVLKVAPQARAKVLAALQKNPNIDFAEPDLIIKHDGTANDYYFPSQWHLSKIQAPAAWDLSTGSSSVVIAVIDSGVESAHADLALKLVPGWNFYDNNNNTADVNGHGTAVAGTAAASVNNSIGVASVAPNCAIMPLRVSDASGYAYESRIAKAITYAADQGARVANVSFRASTGSTVKSAAQYFQNKGGVVVVSSGNEGAFETATDNPYVLTVSATDSNDALPTWSNRGNNVDLSAPGVSILTTTRGNTYASWTGTSFSAPVVAGAAALVISAKPSMTGAQVADVLKKSTDDLGSAGWDTQYGAGRVNVYKALHQVVGGTTPPPIADILPPTVVITAPTEGSRISTRVSVAVKATDNVGVKKVELYVDGALLTSSAQSPFTTTWDAKKARTGAHTLQTRAFDAAGNSSWSQVVTVRK
ncbi:MAG TPA: S8 family serine peptidase [Methylomirabilota bacterium]|nr:S8 family serine peptidase [Methylomirabilota bacterium]